MWIADDWIRIADLWWQKQPLVYEQQPLLPVSSISALKWQPLLNAMDKTYWSLLTIPTTLAADVEYKFHL